MTISTGIAWIATANGLINPAKPVPPNLITPAMTSLIQGVPIWATIDLLVSCPRIRMLLTSNEALASSMLLHIIAELKPMKV